MYSSEESWWEWLEEIGSWGEIYSVYKTSTINYVCADGKGIGIWIDTSHALHADMRGHVGTDASMKKGAAMSSKNRIKFNTPSLTETMIAAVGEQFTKFIWFQYFREAQTWYANEDVLYQYNKSSMLFENNGIYWAGKGINIFTSAII